MLIGNIFEADTIVEGETIQSSRWPCTRSFANPEFFSRDKNSHEKGNSPSSAADSSAKNNSPPLAGDVSPKINASALAPENNLMPGKRQQSKKTWLDALTVGKSGCLLFLCSPGVCNLKYVIYHERKLTPKMIVTCSKFSLLNVFQKHL